MLNFEIKVQGLMSQLGFGVSCLIQGLGLGFNVKVGAYIVQYSGLGFNVPTRV